MIWTPGQLLQDGKYAIEKPLGKGGFGVTYLARMNDGQPAVIKTLNDTVRGRGDFAKFQQDFINEARRLSQCTHPHIVKIYELIQEGTLPAIVMEYIDGENFFDRANNRGALPEAEALHCIEQIGSALAMVHEKGLLHRDVKPANIILCSTKQEAVLIDFGIAREFTQDLTQTHTQFLSPGFAPLEQYQERAKRGAYTDVYGLAATLYFLLTRTLPTPALQRKIGVPLASPQQLNANISDRAERAILTGMALQPSERPQSVQEWLKLLEITSVSASFLSAGEGEKIKARSQPTTQPPKIPRAPTPAALDNTETLPPQPKIPAPLPAAATTVTLRPQQPSAAVSTPRTPPKTEKIRPQPQTRTIPWFWLIGALLIYSLAGRLSASVVAVSSAFILPLAWASVSAWASAAALALVSAWSSTVIAAWAWILVFAFFSALMWIASWILSLVGLDVAVVVWILIAIWLWFALLTWAWFLATAGKKLLSFFNKLHTFLILVGTSWLGLGLGCLWRLAVRGR